MKSKTKNIIPIRIRQFPRYLFEIVLRFIISKRKNDEVTFTLCYFTCYSYYKYLYCSLHSLQKLKVGFKIRVMIFCDINEMLSVEQIRSVESLFPNSKIIPWPKSQGWGDKQITSIWKAYSLAAQKSNLNDYVVRVDSDVFFFNDWIFQMVAASKRDLVGDGHYVNFQYCQGGIYFLRAGAVNDIVKYFEHNSMGEFLKCRSINVEDVAAFEFVKNTKHSTWLTFFMMFPDEYRIADQLTAYQKFKFCCLHFVMKNKNLMLDTYLKEIITDNEKDCFLNALRIQ